VAPPRRDGAGVSAEATVGMLSIVLRCQQPMVGTSGGACQCMIAHRFLRRDDYNYEVFCVIIQVYQRAYARKPQHRRV